MIKGKIELINKTETPIQIGSIILSNSIVLWDKVLNSKILIHLSEFFNNLAVFNQGIVEDTLELRFNNEVALEPFELFKTLNYEYKNLKKIESEYELQNARWGTTARIK